MVEKHQARAFNTRGGGWVNNLMCCSTCTSSALYNTHRYTAQTQSSCCVQPAPPPPSITHTGTLHKNTVNLMCCSTCTSALYNTHRYTTQTQSTRCVQPAHRQPHRVPEHLYFVFPELLDVVVQAQKPGFKLKAPPGFKV